MVLQTMMRTLALWALALLMPVPLNTAPSPQKRKEMLTAYYGTKMFYTLSSLWWSI